MRQFSRIPHATSDTLRGLFGRGQEDALEHAFFFLRGRAHGAIYCKEEGGGDREGEKTMIYNCLNDLLTSFPKVDLLFCREPHKPSFPFSKKKKKAKSEGEV